MRIYVSLQATDVLGIAIEYGMEVLREVSLIIYTLCTIYLTFLMPFWPLNFTSTILQLCVEFLGKSLLASSVCNIIQTAVTYGQDELKLKAVKYIESNTQVSSQIKTRNVEIEVIIIII